MIDADTLDMAGVRIRLHGIDAPERAQSCSRSGAAWPCGQDAMAALAGLVEGRDLRCVPRDRDPYGRLVATCWIGERDVNRWMVAEGWAVAYRRYSTAYVGAEGGARQARRGLWSGTFVMPEDVRRANPR